MKNNYRMILQYDGTRYNGWQKQGNTSHTIQALLEEKLSIHLGEQIELKGSGRTDRGVHAVGQVANFIVKRNVDVAKLKEWLNEELPKDIRINRVESVSANFHSRKSAELKTYEYCIWNSSEKNIFYRDFAYSVEEELNLVKMKQATKFLLGTHDFIGFSSLKEGKKSTVRTIDEILIEQEKNKISIRFTGNGFLYHMVRIMAGTLIEIGKGNMEPDIIAGIFTRKDRNLAGPTAPAQGLKLIEVFYAESC